MSATVHDAFAEGRPWQPEPAPEHVESGAPGAIELAVTLLHQIAEDPFLRPSYRVRARVYFRRLRRAAALTDAGEASP